MELVTVPPWTSIMIAFSAVAYTVGTFLLWLTTRETLAVTRKQNDIMEHRITALQHFERTSIHRDLYLRLLTDKSLSPLLVKTLGGDRRKILKDFMGTWLINHASDLFHERDQDLVGASQWLGIKRDMQAMFKWPIVLNRWRIVREYHPVRFRRFVDSQILRG